MPLASTLMYADFNCPFCYSTEERLHALGLQDAVEWRGVQHAPDLPAVMEPATSMLADELQHEVEMIEARAPEVAIAVPPGKPNTALAIALGAFAQRAAPADARRFIRSIYAAFWRDGHDISDPLVLAELADAAGLPELDPTDTDRAEAAGWERDWTELGGGVPRLVRSDDTMLYGLKDTETLANFIKGGSPAG